MKALKLITLLSAVFFITTSNVLGQQVKEVVKGKNGVPKFIKFDISSQSETSDSKTILRKYLPVKSADQFQLIKTNEDALGFKHEKFQQYYNGIKVEHAVYTVHKKNGVVQSMNGQFENMAGNNADNTPGISEDVALQKALEYIAAEKYMWESEDNEAWAKEVEPSGTFVPGGELVYVKDYYNEDLMKKFQPVLAYKFNIYAEKPRSRDFVYVNAHNGEIVFKNPIIKHCNNPIHNYSKLPGTGNLKENKNFKVNAYAATRYSGVRTIKTSISGSNYVLRDYTRGNGIETFNMQTGTNYNAAIDFTDADNQWTATEHNNSAKDNAALDAHWGAEKVWDYWMIKHGRNSFDGYGAVIKSYVHYSSNYDNAYWNGSVMTYGDGSGFDALTCIDIVAHEIGHAITDYTSDLVYAYEPGAMNEGFSDIWGACVEYYVDPGKSTWLIGEEIGGPLRSMSNPNAYGQPDTYLGTNWYTGSGDDGGVHTNSGVLNFWFYLLTEGGSGTNDNADAYNVTGIGIDKAAKIAYRTLVYLSPYDQYADARGASILAASDIYGANSNEVQQVKNAWDAVGVPDFFSGSYCASQSNNQMYLIQVDIGDDFSNSSGGSYYSDFTAQTVDLTTGEGYNIYLKQGGYWGGINYQLHWIIWIDLNGDYDFDDAGEEVFYGQTPYGTEDIYGSFFMPDATATTTRMRVSISYAGQSKQSSCGNMTYGEVEDYTVNITQGLGGGGDKEPPSVPTNLNATNITESSVNLSWNASTDNIGVAGYKVYKDGTLVKTLSGTVTSTIIYGLSKDTPYNFYVKAYDGADNLSSRSNTVYITTQEGDADTKSPTTPQNLTYSNLGQTSLQLHWTASTDSVGVVKYRIYQNGSHHSYVTGTSALIEGLTPGTNYDYRVRAYDLANNASWYSNYVYPTTESDTDTEDPTSPTNLIAGSVGETDVLLEWDASTDNVGVHHYNIYKDAMFETTSSGTGAVINGLNTFTNYSFYVTAEDDEGNESNQSNTVNVTTEGEAPCSNNFTLTIYTDFWSSETSWDIKNSSNVTVESGSGYSSNSTIVENFTLTTNETYTFTIYDSWGDGIWNDPGYRLENGNGIIFEESGYDFSSSRSHGFGVCAAHPLPSYCSTNGDDNSEEWIDYVGLGSINNITGSEAGGYGDYTNLTPMVLSPHSYTLYLSAGYSGLWYNEYWRVWIDFNIDGDFNDAGELVVEGGPFAYDGIIKAQFIVPTTISSGYTVMRVSMKYNDYPSSCETFTYGEVEDYPIELSTTKSGNDQNLANISARDISNPLPEQFELYPNPTNNFIKITQTGSEKVTYKIYNMMGELVKSSVLENGGMIDVSELPKGVYNLQFNTKRRLENKQFVKY